MAKEIRLKDKVRFLNEVGGGIVVGFQGKEIALVEDQDGFSIPMAIRDLVVVETDQYNIPTQAEKQRRQAEQQAHKEQQAPPHEDFSKESLSEGTPSLEMRGRELLNVSLAFVPDDIRQVTTTSFASYLINDSNLTLFFTYQGIQNGSCILRSSGLMEPNTKILLEEFGREALNDMEHVCVQLLAFKPSKSYSLQKAVSVEVRVDTVKFYKLHTFLPNAFFTTPALIYPVVKDGVPQRQVFVDKEDLQAALMGKKRQDSRPQAARVVKPQPKNGPIEVDLHIHELLDDLTGLEASDMLRIQMEHFEKVMEENIKFKGRKIVFIHGKGEGVLRKSILSELKLKYPSCRYQDASFQEYGWGATMVTIY